MVSAAQRIRGREDILSMSLFVNVSVSAFELGSFPRTVKFSGFFVRRSDASEVSVTDGPSIWGEPF